MRIKNLSNLFLSNEKLNTFFFLNYGGGGEEVCIIKQNHGKIIEIS